jgi:lipopolysaccharide transport system ATP-binding protein
MSNVAIKVENLGEKYLIRHQQKESYQTFQDLILKGSSNIIQSLNPFNKKSQKKSEFIEEFWALDNINFEINKGDKVGIIGRNGAGKSTLLKVLSRITEPTKGKIHINGCIASLLEVGTGFHPELTSRENIFLNGAIWGMSSQEVKNKFDETIAFAEVEKFLDTP